MDYDGAIKYIESTSRFGMNLGLGRIEKLLEYMGNPQKSLKCIHIAGTNGKGSVTAMIGSILTESGYKVGIYTSPYLQRFTERIRINDREIPQSEVARLITFVKPLVEKMLSEGYEHPTEFEIITAVMFKYFEENKVDFAVIEVGLGGRLDSTNVINPLVSVITTISYDHMGVLGDTLSQIASEKAGIIKNNGIVVMYPQVKEAAEVIRKTCIEKNAKLLEVNDKGTQLREYSMDGQMFDLQFDDDEYKSLHMRLLGEHQLINCKTAIEAVRALSLRGIKIGRESIYKGIRNTRWAGRLEVMAKSPTILLDGAHNIQGIESLRAALHKYFKYDRLILVIGILKDKEYSRMSSIIMPEAQYIITAVPDSSRALPSDKLGEIALNYCSNVYISKDIDDAFAEGLKTAGPDDLLLFCGSLYMVGHVRTNLEKFLKNESAI